LTFVHFAFVPPRLLISKEAKNQKINRNKKQNKNKNKKTY